MLILLLLLFFSLFNFYHLSFASMHVLANFSFSASFLFINYARDSLCITIQTMRSGMQQFYVELEDQEKLETLHDIIKETEAPDIAQCIIYCNQQSTVILDPINRCP